MTDPLGYTTVTNLDGQGRKTDYTDKRNFVTTYTYNKFGEVTEAFFNQNNKFGYAQEKVDMSNFDALDRVGQITETVNGNTQSTQTFAYDSLDSVLSMTDTANSATPVSYSYDKNGRRTSMQVTLNGVAQTPVNYGYDCDDRLIGMSNNGTAIQSCSPTNQITNGDSSTQFAFGYEGVDKLLWMLSDGGVLTWDTGIDNDERTTERDYFSYPDFVEYGSLTYGYDLDGHLIDKGDNGTGLAAVNMPAAVSTTSYSATDQVTNWNGTATTPDKASNITTDPASGTTLSWNARNQASNVGGISEKYDGLGRRETNSVGLSFQYDGSTMVGWSETGASYNFTTMPGGEALAGAYTANGSTSTYLPLIDTDGSTIGLVNAANADAGRVTTYTYSPSGTPALSGATNLWPFLFQGGEQEFIDAPYYYAGSGQFYSPQMVRSLSEAGQTSASGPGGSGGFSPVGRAISIPSGSSGGLSPQSVGNDAQQALQVGNDIYNTADQIPITYNEIPIALPLALIGGSIDFLVNFFEDIFGGADNPPPPRQLRHGRHPLYPVILGLPAGLTPDPGLDSSEKPQFCGDPAPCPNARPLQKKEPTPEYRKPPTLSFEACLGFTSPGLLLSGARCGLGLAGCVSALYANPEGPSTCIKGSPYCGVTAAIIYTCYEISRGNAAPSPPNDLNPSEEMPP